VFNYIFPIFAFGLIITGVVFIGLQQASDLARELTAQRSEAEKRLAQPIPTRTSASPTAAEAQ
jgi:hypothetical protein